MSMVKMTIDGRELKAEAGRSLLDASLAAGIEVPHFCYHPGIGVEGSCRLCLVEVAGEPKLQTSCTVPIKEGMVVRTSTDAAKKARKGVLEFFLLHHPLDCPICDKGGECPLQNYSLDAGQSESRFEFAKLNKEKHRVIGEHIILDKERCVLCDRCVRFLRDFTGREELQIRNRGADSEIFVPEGKSLTSGFTGNLADLCPVGALLSRDFRFKARPWEMTTVDTVCGECSLGCSVQAWKKKNDVLRLTPRVEPAVNEWWLCDRGRYSPKALTTGERLCGFSNGKDFPPLVESVASELKKLPAGYLGIVLDPSLTNEEVFLLRRVAWLAGRGRVFAPVAKGTVDIVQKLAATGIEADFPTSLEESSLALVVGENVEIDHPVLALRLRKLRWGKEQTILTAGDGDLGFTDLAAAALSIREESETKAFFEKLAKLEAGKRPASHNKGEEIAWQALTDATSISAFVAGRSVLGSALEAMNEWLEACVGRKPRRSRVSLLLSGANTRGIVDQWDASMRSQDELATDIQRGRVEGLLWFGKAPLDGVFDEYARGMRTFVQFVLRKEEAHPRARQVFPLDTYLEKEGTYTNTFGRVQAVRRATRVVDHNHEPVSVVSQLAAQLGESVGGVRQVYEEIAKGVQRYPSSWSEIPESKRSYHHYERALWR